MRMGKPMRIFFIVVYYHHITNRTHAHAQPLFNLKINNMNTSHKRILPLFTMLLALVCVMSTSCTTHKPCTGVTNKPVTYKYVKHTDFRKKHYHF